LNFFTNNFCKNDDDLKKEGAIYDETGNDGIDSSEEIFAEGTEMR
jgi:hypothetical protein